VGVLGESFEVALGSDLVGVLGLFGSFPNCAAGCSAASCWSQTCMPHFPAAARGGGGGGAQPGKRRRN
jgi:hypothetical protein